MRSLLWNRLVVGLAGASIAATCGREPSIATARGSVGGIVPRVVINEVMANPRRAPDARGEWFELHNAEAEPVDLRGWTIASANDPGETIPRGVVVPPHGYAVLARDDDPTTNGGVRASYAYGGRVALGNRADWLVLRSPDGRTVDSVGWTSAISGASRELADGRAPHADVDMPPWYSASERYGSGDLGTPGRANVSPSVAARPPEATGDTATAVTRAGPPRLDSLGPPHDSTLIVRVLDVGQGDAILIENGGSRVLIDGGPEPTRLGELLDQFSVTGTTIDVVILTHQHSDHYGGLRELFRTSRRVTVRYVFENKDPSPQAGLAELRDSIIARARRGELEYRDTDDPCGTGAQVCTVTLRAGARIHILRPAPRGDGRPNNRSAVVKLVAADSTAFSMWLPGDAERRENSWFDAADYDRSPGMGVPVLKGNHHGSCDGISPRYLDLVRPEMVAMSLAAINDYGYVHRQTLALLRSRGIPWYRTDQNGTITITVPRAARANGSTGNHYTVSVERGGANMTGPRDRRARQC